MTTKWHAVIGLEVHAQLSTQTKLFSRSATRFGAHPNSQASFVDCALPGTLPVLNQEALHQAIRFGLACDATIQNRISFDRKNYYYPDLPKGYQITQHHYPILVGGHVDIVVNDVKKRINIHHSHLEEDAGKSNHDYSMTQTGIDLNRAGMPLLEIVSEPEIRTPQEAVAYIKALHKMVVFYEISDGNMQEGSLRIDVNVSLRRSEDAPFGTKVEIKNINSFKFVEKALNHEISRQAEILEAGGTIEQQTRLFDEASSTTIFMRGKEDAHDYRYHKDPDIPYITIDDQVIASIQATMPESPQAKCTRYQNDYALSEYDANIISQDKDFSDIFDAIVQQKNCKPKLLANWILGPVASAINRSQVSFAASPVATDQLAQLLGMIEQGTASNNNAKLVFEKMWETGEAPAIIIKEEGLEEVSDEQAIRELIDAVLHENPKQVQSYLDGNAKIAGFFVGQIMKKGQGKINPKVANTVLQECLAALDKGKS